MTPQDVRQLIDQILPVPDGEFPSLKLIEQRHILIAYLVGGSHEKAAKLLDVSTRTVRNRLKGVKAKRRRASTMLHEIVAVEVPISEIVHDEDLSYPCHRDFKFFDWYHNQDHVWGRGVSRPNKKHSHRYTIDGVTHEEG